MQLIEIENEILNNNNNQNAKKTINSIQTHLTKLENKLETIENDIRLNPNERSQIHDAKKAVQTNGLLWKIFIVTAAITGAVALITGAPLIPAIITSFVVVLSKK